jgi:hypothetical protein
MSKRYSALLNDRRNKTDGTSTTRKPENLHGIPQARHDGETPKKPTQTHPSTDALVAEAAAQLLSYTDGWLRLTPDTEHKTLFLKFKWRRGAWAGHYVMSVVQPHELGMGLDLLLSKVVDVYAGTRKPTKDTPYDA